MRPNPQSDVTDSQAAANRQATIRTPVAGTGVGLHSGRPIQLGLLPAGPNTGLVVRRTDVAHDNEIPLRWTHVVDTAMATTVGNRAGIRVGTVEHLMAALAGAAIDNAIVEVDGPEIPVFDGSAEPFSCLIDQAGRAVQRAPRQAIRVLKTVSVGDADKRLTVRPAPRFSIGFEIDFDSPAIARQTLALEIDPESFRAEIARARTFGFAHEVEQLRRAGLALGGSLDNAVVIGDGRVLNADGLRFPDEFVRHKILDCVGDLYLAGAPVIGHVHGVRSGHSLNNRLLHALFADRDAWCLVDATRSAERLPRAAEAGWAAAAARAATA